MVGTDLSHLTNDELIKGIQSLKLPEYIRSKAYGIDVRETLAQMTEMLMQLAYNQGMSPQQAKDWVSRLNNKIDKGSVSVNDINKNLGKLDQTFMTDEFLQQMAGNAPINSVPADNSLDTMKFIDKSVTPEKTSFLSATQEHNLFNPTDVGVGGYYAWQDGVYKTDERYSYSGVIPVELNKKYEIRYVDNVTFWEEDKETFVSGNAYAPKTFIVTNPKIKYVRLAYLTSAKNKVILSTFGHAVDKYKVGNQFLIDSDSVHELEPTSLKYIEVTTKHNLFNRNDVNNGRYHNHTNGEIITDATMSRSGTIPVEVGKTYYLSKVVKSMTFWEGNKTTFVSGSAYTPSVTIRNERIKYVKLNFNTSDRDSVVITSYPSAQTELYKLSDKFLIEPSDIFGIDVTTEHNLFNPSDVGVGGYYRWQDGTFTTDERYSYSGTIPVELNKKYEMRDVDNVTFWEGDKTTFVSGNAYAPTTFTVTNPKIKYVRLAYLTSSKNRVILSAFGHAVDKYKVGNQLLIDSESVSDLDPISLKHIEVTTKHNLFNRNDVSDGEYHNLTTGETIKNATMSRSGTIPVEVGKTYYLSATPSMTFWEGDKTTFVSGNVYAPSVTIRNERIKYVKLNYNTSDRDKVVITSYPNAQPELYKLSDKFLIEPNDIFGIEEYLTDATQPFENESRELLKPYNKVVNPVLTKDVITDRNAQGVADPFIVNDKGRFHMFFEVLSDVSEEIGHAFSDDLINWQYTQIVLSKEETGHRSAYPNVFKVDEKWYMIPDTAGQGNVYLYEAVEFPLNWQLVTKLIDTPSTIVDTNVFKMGDDWYMTTTGGADGWDKGVALYVNTSGDWKNNQWQKHPSGIIIPIDSENRGYRGAGNVKVFDGYVLLPIQATPTSTDVYGERAYLYKISNLSLTTANANRMGVLVEAAHNGSWNHRSMHHASWTKNGNDTIYAVDGQTSTLEYAIGLYVDK